MTHHDFGASKFADEDVALVEAGISEYADLLAHEDSAT